MFFLVFWESLLIEKHKEASKFHFYFLLHFIITTQLLLERGPAKKKQLVHKTIANPLLEMLPTKIVFMVFYVPSELSYLYPPMIFQNADF